MNRKPTKEVQVNGVMMTVYSIGWLALLTNKGIANIRRWERLGILPKPIVEIPGEDRRYYLASELIGYKEIYLRSNVRAGFPIHKTPFKREARSFRNQLQVIISNPKKLEMLHKKIPNEKAYNTKFQKDREAKIRAEAHDIVSRVQETEYNNPNEKNKINRKRRKISLKKEHRGEE